MVQASRIAAASDIDLTADTGVVALLSGTDSTFEQQKHQKKGLVWQSARDKGESATSVVMTELEAGGELSIESGAGIVADYRDTGGLEASLAALAQDPATAWVAELARRDDVTWRAVNQAYTSWDHKSQGLTGPAAMVIAIAVTVATQGAGAAVWGAATGTTVAAGTMTAAIANAGLSALVAQASVSLINNQGDLGKVLKELGSVQTVKSLATAVVTAGLTHGIAGELGIAVSKTADLQNRLALQGVQAASSVAANTVIGGVKFTDALRSQLIAAAVNAAAAEGFRAYAQDNGIANGSLGKKIHWL